MKMVTVCVLLAAMFVVGQAQQNTRETDRVRVLALETAWNEAEKNKDDRALNALLAPSFAYTDSDGSFMNKSQFLASVTAPSYHPGQITNDEMRADPYDHVVVVTGIYHEQGAESGKSYTRRGRFTDTWVQENRGWLCAASQETLIGH
jgi:ketosteroid isomerase-like protein